MLFMISCHPLVAFGINFLIPTAGIPAAITSEDPISALAPWEGLGRIRSTTTVFS